MENEVSSSISGGSFGNSEPGRKKCVVIPTTGGLVWVRGLKKRPRLKSSYAIMDGDFRPLKLSKDYHYFVSGPLTLVNDPPDIFELSLSDNIDSGRSWEFPTLVAHLLEKQQNLVFADRQSLEEHGDPGHDLIWATGMLDPDLAPVAADYMLARKLELSRPLFEKCAKYKRRMDIFLCADLPADERALFREAARQYGGHYHEISTLDDLTTILGGDTASAPHDDEKQPETRKQEEQGEQAGLPAGPKPAIDIPRPVLVSAVAVAAIVFLWAGYSFFGPGSSNGLHDPESAHADGTGAFMIEQLMAADQHDCRRRVMMAERFETKGLAKDKAATFNPKSFRGLCGLRFRNTGSTPFRLQLSEALENYAITGSDTLFTGRTLQAGKVTDLYLSRLPVELSAQLTITPEKGPRKRFQIKFTRP